MNEEFIKQFIQNQQKIIDLQQQEIDQQKNLNDNLKFIRDTLEVTPEEQKAIDLKNQQVKKEHDKQISDLKDLISSLDNKKEISALDSDIQSLNANVSTSFEQVHKGFDTLSFNTQYSNNLCYWFIVVLGFVFLIYVFYKFLKIFL